MTFRVIILPQAETDIEAHARWWAVQHSTEQAARWFDAIHVQIATLTSLPESNGLSAENAAFPYEIRDKLLGLGSRPSYRAVFTIRADIIYVLTVRRGAQDILDPALIAPPP